MKQNGFTLMELIIVIAILAILSAISVPVFAKVQNNAKHKADIVSASVLANAAQLYYQENNQPDTISINDLINKEYIQSEPIPQSIKESSFSLVVTEGVAKVSIGSEVFYPKLDEKIEKGIDTNE